MLYTLLACVALVASTLASPSYIKFSKSEFYGDCQTDHEITEIDGSDLSTILYFCAYVYQIPAGIYHQIFYDEHDYKVYQFDDINIKHQGTGNIKGHLSLSLLLNGYVGDQSYWLKLQDWQYNTFVGGKINVRQPVRYAEVADVAVRYIAPSKMDEYYSTAPGSYGNGAVLEVLNALRYLYFCTVLHDVADDYTVQFHYKGLKSKHQFTGPLKVINEGKYGRYDYGYCDYAPIRDFQPEEDIKVTAYLYNKDHKEEDSKYIKIKYEIVENDATEEPETTVSTSSTSTTSTSTTSTTTETPLVVLGICVEKPGKQKKACAQQMSRKDCEAISKCEWVEPN